MTAEIYRRQLTNLNACSEALRWCATQVDPQAAWHDGGNHVMKIMIKAESDDLGAVMNQISAISFRLSFWLENPKWGDAAWVKSYTKHLKELSDTYNRMLGKRLV
jgi:hypothetical protein